MASSRLAGGVADGDAASSKRVSGLPSTDFGVGGDFIPLNGLEVLLAMLCHALRDDSKPFPPEKGVGFAD